MRNYPQIFFEFNRLGEDATYDDLEQDFSENWCYEIFNIMNGSVGVGLDLPEIRIKFCAYSCYVYHAAGEQLDELLDLLQDYHPVTEEEFEWKLELELMCEIHKTIRNYKAENDRQICQRCLKPFAILEYSQLEKALGDIHRKYA